jgi:Caspase domain
MSAFASDRRDEVSPFDLSAPRATPPTLEHLASSDVPTASGAAAAADLGYAACWTEDGGAKGPGLGAALVAASEGKTLDPQPTGTPGGFSYLLVLGAILRAESLAQSDAATPRQISDALAALDQAEGRMLAARVVAAGTKTATILEGLTRNVRQARETLLGAADARVQRRLGEASTSSGGPEGSLLMVGATSEDTIAYDRGGYAQTVTKDLGDPAADVRATMERWASATFDPFGYVPQSPTLVKTPGTAATGGAPRRRVAVYVANSDYQGMGDLSSPVKDTDAIKGQLGERGYENVVHANKSADEMQEIYGAAVTAHGLGPGDSLFLYYSGHGIREGLLGVNATRNREIGHNVPEYDGDLYHHAHLNAATRGATGRGIDTTVLVDACYAGEGVSQMRRLEMDDLAKETGGTDLAAVTELARKIDGVKRRFGGVSLTLQANKLGAGLGSDDPVANASGQLLLADLVVELSALGRQFESLSGKPLTSLARLPELSTKVRSFDIVDDLTNEVLAHIHAKQAREGLP